MDVKEKNSSVKESSPSPCSRDSAFVFNEDSAKSQLSDEKMYPLWSSPQVAYDGYVVINEPNKMPNANVPNGC